MLMARHRGQGGDTPAPAKPARKRNRRPATETATHEVEQVTDTPADTAGAATAESPEDSSGE
jgi:hypothetical protein